ncbi:MAG: hypothetical protein M3Z06_02235 [Actinomycetota bacterium]|nr:hypothetical protein [Actinomycetota bacterium]
MNATDDGARPVANGEPGTAVNSGEAASAEKAPSTNHPQTTQLSTPTTRDNRTATLGGFGQRPFAPRPASTRLTVPIALMLALAPWIGPDASMSYARSAASIRYSSARSLSSSSLSASASATARTDRIGPLAAELPVHHQIWFVPSRVAAIALIMDQQPVASSEPEAGACWEHRWAASVDGLDDLAGVDALEVGAGNSEVGVPELPLDDGERNAFTGHLDRVGVPELVRREPPAYPGAGAEMPSSARAPA